MQLQHMPYSMKINVNLYQGMNCKIVQEIEIRRSNTFLNITNLTKILTRKRVRSKRIHKKFLVSVVSRKLKVNLQYNGVSDRTFARWARNLWRQVITPNGQ